MSLATPSCVQKLQAASHGISCVFSESRMREICLSGSISGGVETWHGEDNEAPANERAGLG